MGKRICLGLFICLLACSLSASAQETTGGIQGTVKDPQGAVIPGATVEVSSPALIGKKTATTDSGGFFHIEQLPPGTYSISVNAVGFAPATRGNLELRTGALPTIGFTMQVGEFIQERFGLGGGGENAADGCQGEGAEAQRTFEGGSHIVALIVGHQR